MPKDALQHPQGAAAVTCVVSGSSEEHIEEIFRVRSSPLLVLFFLLLLLLLLKG